MSIKIKEILKTDSLAGSRIILNSNFKAINDYASSVDSFFIFDEETGNRKGLTSSLLNCDAIVTEKIKNFENKELIFYKDNTACLKFNNDGDVIIKNRNNSELSLNLQDKLSEIETLLTSLSERIQTIDS